MAGRACILVHELGRSGGMAVIAAHARALAADGRLEPELVVTGAAGDLPADLDGVPVASLADARGREYDVAVGTWWTTAGHLFELGARVRVMFLQSLEDRFYAEKDFFERLGASSLLALPVHFVTVASWIRDVLAELRPDARCAVVRNGIDKDVFAARPARDAGGPLRVLVEGQPTLWFKGVADAVAAVRAMAEPSSLTLVGPEAEPLAGLDADRREAALGPRAMADLYAEHDVLLKLSRVESLGLPPLEAFHVGRPAVLTPFTGHEEYAVHGRNALVVDMDDGPGTTAALDLLARDGNLRARLGRGALETAAAWPSLDDAGRAFADELADLAAGPAPSAEGAARLGQRLVRQWIEVGRQHPDHVRALLGFTEHELEKTRRGLEHAEARIESIQAERAYRLAARARRMLPGRDA